MKTITTVTHRSIYYIKQDDTTPQSNRSATITFEDKKFDECSYHLNCNSYDYEDWMFLKEISIKIEKIKKQFDTKKS